MNKKIYIVEDEPLIAETIKTALTKEGYQIIGMSDNAKEALFDIEHLQPELILLDINIEGTIDGIELAGYIKKKCNIPFIFLTSHSDDMTLERVKKMEPAGYIVKPFNEKTLKTNIELAIHKANAQIQNISSNDSVDSIFIKNKGELIKIQLEDIYYLEAYDNYCFLHTATQKNLLSYTLKSVEEKLPSQKFMRVHRSYIINLSKIKSLQEGYVFTEKHKIPVSNSYKDALMSKINLL
jgi:DNA-binding LytR/AlgR family response regulator